MHVLTTFEIFWNPNELICKLHFLSTMKVRESDVTTLNQLWMRCVFMLTHWLQYSFPNFFCHCMMSVSPLLASLFLFLSSFLDSLFQPHAFLGTAVCLSMVFLIFFFLNYLCSSRSSVTVPSCYSLVFLLSFKCAKSFLAYPLCSWVYWNMSVGVPMPEVSLIQQNEWKKLIEKGGKTDFSLK